MEAVRNLGFKFQSTFGNLKTLVDGQRLVEGADKSSGRKFNIYIERVRYSFYNILDYIVGSCS